MTETITVDILLARFELQGVPPHHYAVKCPRCSRVQSIESFLRSGAFATAADAELQLGYTCVGRFIDKEADGCGCTYSLPGAPDPPLMVEQERDRQPCFALATPEEAQQLFSSWRNK